MVAAGAAEEVLAAEAAGASRTARVALGYEQLLDGDVEAMKRAHRRYARRQITWMSKMADLEIFDRTDSDPGELAAAIVGAPALSGRDRDTAPR